MRSSYWKPFQKPTKVKELESMYGVKESKKLRK